MSGGGGNTNQNDDVVRDRTQTYFEYTFIRQNTMHHAETTKERCATAFQVWLLD